MDKSKILIIVVSILVVGVIAVLFGQKFLKIFSTKEESVSVSINIMEGNITKVDGSVITIEGTVDGKIKSVSFTITDTTILNNSANVITMEQLKSGKQFSPKTDVRKGELQELKVGTHISRITTRGDLAKINQAVAVEINYITYDLPKIK